MQLSTNQLRFNVYVKSYVGKGVRQKKLRIGPSGVHENQP